MKSESAPPYIRATQPGSGDTGPMPSAVLAERLFGGAKEIVIRHRGDDYRLRITRNDKLILTK